MAELSIPLPTYAADDPESWKFVLDRAVAADRGGVDRVTASEHVIYGENLDAYSRPELGGAAGGAQPTGPDGRWLDSLTVLTWVAAQTTRLRVATNILLAALRTPAVLAKQLATIDVLSGGRLDVGVGVGWQREEYEASGLEFENRGRRLNQVLEIMQMLWRDPVAAYDGPGFRFERIHAQPKPVQPGGVPIWVSGTVNTAVARRLGKYAAGWILWGPAADDPETGIAQMRQALADEGFDPSNLQVAAIVPAVRKDDGWMDVDATMARLPALAGAGITDFRMGFRAPKATDEAADYYAEVVDAFRKATA
jgi:probable F420-dependent oxidoreductase